MNAQSAADVAPDIRALVELNDRLGTRQGSVEEYACIAGTIAQRRPCNLLVFGTGRDSPLWLKANHGGATVFLEHAARWIDSARAAVPGIVVHPVRYDTRRWQWRTLLTATDRLFLTGLPQSVQATPWDIVFVDAPTGNRFWHIGRMRSIYTAAMLTRKSRAGGSSADVFVHDCNRTVERVYADRYLGAGNLVEEVRWLRHYRLSHAPSMSTV